MELNLIDKLILLALDDDKGTFAAEPMAVQYGLAGAVILELFLQERIKIVDKKVVIKNRTRIGDDLLDGFVKTIANSKRERTLMHWVQTFGNKVRDIKKQTLNKLITKGILTKREEKFLWVFNNDKYPTSNVKPENTLRKRLYQIIENNQNPEVDELMLISLIDTCKLNRVVYGKQREKNFRKNIKNAVKVAKNNTEIGATIKEVNDIIQAMMVVIITT